MENGNKFFDSIISAILGDIVGYFNGIWEFNYGINVDKIDNVSAIHYKILEHYIELGTFENLPYKIKIF